MNSFTITVVKKLAIATGILGVFSLTLVGSFGINADATNTSGSSIGSLKADSLLNSGSITNFGDFGSTNSLLSTGLSTGAGSSAGTIASNNSGTPSCPYTGANVYAFDGTRLLSDRGPTQQTKSVSLPAGKYKIEYYSYDTYPKRPDANLYQQDQEQWNLILKNSTGGTITQFGPTKDVPDGVVLGEITGVFTTGTDINQPIASMVAQHKLHPKDKNPHSVAPGCIKFTKIEQPTPTPDPTPDPKPVAPSCPFVASGNTYVVDFDGRIRSDKTSAQATIGPVSANLPAGTYTVDLASWDGYIGRENVTQPNEKWYVDFGNGVRSLDSVDVEDRKREAYTQTAAGQVVLSQGVSSITVRHSVYPDKTSPNSVNPICAKFTKKPDPKPEPKPVRPSCPFNATADTYIVNFSGHLRSDKTSASAVIGPVATGLSAGTYAVTLASWDGYNGRENVTQPNERWYVDFGSGVRSQNSTDVADYKREAYTETPVGQVELTQAISSVTARHAVYPDKTSPNSVVPICAKFKKIKEEPKPLPVCSLQANPSALLKGESTTLSWTTQNASIVTFGNGVVASNGSKTRSPAVTTTYRVTAKNADGAMVQCTTQVKVTEPIPAPTCEMWATESTIEKGQSTKLGWRGTNVSLITIDNNLGEYLFDGMANVSPETTTTYTGVFTGENGEEVSCSATIIVNIPETPPVRPECPIPAQDGRVIVDFSDWLRSDKSYPEAQTARKDVDLSTGTYKVSLASWDGHIGRENQSQSNEIWKVIVTNENGYVSGTNASTDLADMVREVIRTDVVNNEFLITEEVTTIYGEHAAYPDTASVNSLHPLCVAFDKIKEEEKPAPTCELSASDSIVSKGGSTALIWNGEHITSVTIDNGVGAVAGTQGSQTVTVNETTTFTGDYVGENGDTIQCSTTVTVEKEDEPAAPVCSLNVNPSRITSSGQAVTLSWSSNNTVSGSINQSVGDVDVDGSLSVKPGKSRTYTGTFVGENGDEVTCTASVTKRKGGGGGACLNCGKDDDDPKDDPEPTEPEVTVARTVVKANPGSFIYLDQVPYTGFEAGPLMTTLFWLGLLAVSAFVSYLIVVKKIFSKLFFGASVAQTETAGQEIERADSFLTSTAPVAPLSPAYQFQTDADEATGGDMQSDSSNNGSSDIEDVAQQAGVLFSPEAKTMVDVAVSREGETLVIDVIELAKETYPREDGWILLSKERVQTLLARRNGRQNGERTKAFIEQGQPSTPKTDTASNSTDTNVTAPEASAQTDHSPLSAALNAISASDEPKAPSAPVQSTTAAPVVNSNLQNVGSSLGKVEADKFVAWLVAGDQSKVYEALRSASAQSGSVEVFIGNIVRELDEVYKHRIEGGHAPNANLVQTTATWTNPDFEAVLGTLVESIDYSYSSSRIGTKVALAKLFEYFANKR